MVPFPAMKVKSFPCCPSPEGKLEDMQETLVDLHYRGSRQHSQCGSCETRNLSSQKFYLKVDFEKSPISFS